MYDRLNVIRKKLGLPARNRKGKHRTGFTLIEVLVVIGILAILATLVLVAVNPTKQFKMARETKRSADVATIMSAVSQNITDNEGLFICQGGPIALPLIKTEISTDELGIDLAACLVPEYIGALPFDSGNPNAYWNTQAEYNTGYSINKDPVGRITISVPSELADSGYISITR